MAEIYAVSLALNEKIITRLFFNSHVCASAAFEKLSRISPARVEVEDDYGTKISVSPYQLLLITLEDPKRVAEGQGEVALVNARVQAAVNKKAQNDPTLQLLTPGGPPPGFKMV